MEEAVKLLECKAYGGVGVVWINIISVSAVADVDGHAVVWVDGVRMADLDETAAAFVERWAEAMRTI